VEEARTDAGLPPMSEASPPDAPAAEEPEPRPAADEASAAAARGEAVAVERLVDEKDRAQKRGETDPTVFQIGPTPTGDQPRPPLAQAAAAERDKRRLEQRPKATLVINNDNLAAFAADGQLTVVTPGTAAPAESTQEPATAGTAAGESPSRGPAGPRDEVYWRDRTRDVRTRWADASEEVERLELQAAQLRWDFYAEDDPYYRDERIKPEWDRVLDELRRARQDIRAYSEELAEVLTEGRRAGALPGWLREGIEFEPEEPDSPIRRSPAEGDVSEPTVYGERNRP
jgi:hypothetical protein